MPEITLAITSCGRHDLLERTLRSFVQFNSHPIKETVIVEDGELGPPAWLRSLHKLGPVKWIANGARKGQIYSADRAYAEITTPYVFWCEDDWEFSRSGFMEESLEILEQHPSILQVSLRSDHNHPAIDGWGFPFPILEPKWAEGWSGFAFNPGLRRLSDYRRIGSYGREVGYDPSFVGELHLSKLYYSLGYFAAAIPGACRHIGGGNRHVPWATAPKVPKVLIAIPACHKYEYGEHPDARIDHRDRISTERVDAIRATWAKYLPAFASYVDLRFFYGRGSRQPLSDEVFLPVPDDYDNLPHKIKAIYQWILEHRYQYSFKCDDDSFAYLDRLMASGFENYDYLGYCYPSNGNYITGGPGYWLSARMMRLVVAEPVSDWAEDKWVGGILKRHGIHPVRDARYLPGFSRHFVDVDKLPEDHSYISFHACTPAMMHKLYAANPSPTFRLTHLAQGEFPLYPEAASYPLNIQPMESVFVDGKRVGQNRTQSVLSSTKYVPSSTQIMRGGDECHGGPDDPRRGRMPQGVHQV